MKLRNSCFALSLLVCMPLHAQQTLIHYSVSDTQTAQIAAGVVPNVGTLGNGIVSNSISLSASIPVTGVPPGLGNRAMVFSGAGGILAPGLQQLNNTNIFNAGGFTYEAWFNTTGAGNVNAIIDYAGTQKLVRFYNSTGPAMEYYNSNNSPVTTTIGTATSNQWHYAAVVFAATALDSQTNLTGNFTFYLDGNVVAGTVSGATISPFGDSLNRTIGVGMHPSGFASDFFNGMIFEPRVTLGALPAYELLFKPNVVITSTNDSGSGSLRSEISLAPNGAVITFASSLNGQTITLTNGEITFHTNMTIDASSLPNGITISGNHTSRIFQVNPGFGVTLNSLTLANGNAPTGGYPGNSGGAVLNYGFLNVNACTFQNNQAVAGSFPGGGGIECQSGSLTVSNCTFTGNASEYGGGIDCEGGTITLFNSTFNGNSGSSEGGGIFTAIQTSVGKDIERSGLPPAVGINNYVDPAAAHVVILSQDPTPLGISSGGNPAPVFCNCTFFGNSAPNGGGIANGGNLVFVQCTLTGNTAVSYGGGFYIIDGAAYGTNDIVAGNSAADGADGYIGGLSIVDLDELITTGQMLAPLGYYGGPTQTMPPLPGSAAIGAGVNIPGLATDQRGSAHAVGIAPDAGAVTSGGLWVTNNSGSGAGSLRAVLASAASVPNPKIVLFTPSLSGATILLGSALLLTNPYGVTIDALPLPRGIALNGGGTSRIFYVTNGAIASAEGLTIANGSAAPGDFAGGGGGGGIFCQGRLGLVDCTVVSNYVTGESGFNSFAGAIGVNGGDMRLTNCTVAYNTTYGANGEGGAFYNYLGTLVFDQCTVANNLATAVNGGVANGGTTTLRATVLANGNIDFLNDSDGVSLGDNFINDGSNSGLSNGLNGDHVGTSSAPLNPQLGPYGYFGGPTPTLPPLPGSPLVDAGGTSDVGADQRGYPRPIGTAADIGAVEGVYNTSGPGKLTNVMRLADGSVQFKFNGLTESSFPVLATLNATLATSNWTQIGFATESPIGSGHFLFNDWQAAIYPQRFYRVFSP